MPLEGFFNRSSIDEVTTHTGTWTAAGDENFAAKVRYSPAWAGNYSAARQPTDQNDGMTFELDKAGSGSKLWLEFTEQQLDETGAAGTDNTHTVFGKDDVTLGAFIAAVNKSTGLDGKLEMVALDAPSDFATDNAFWINVVAGTQQIPIDGRWINILNIDHSSTNTECFLRIGYPEVQDTGRLAVLRVTTTATHGLIGTVKLYRDVVDGSGTAPTLLLDLGATGASTVSTTHLDHNKLEAGVFRGPLLLGIEGVTAMVSASIEVSTICAEW